MSTSPHEITFTSRAGAALDTVRTLVVPTDLSDVDCVELARRAAAEAASGRSMSIVLYDRSGETWMDTPHPSGPHRAADLDERHRHLVDQLRELDDAGIDASAWISTVPALTDIITAVQQVPADAVLLPSQACDRTLVDRLTGRGDTNDDVAATIDRQIDRRVTVFSVTDGTVDVLQVTSPESARR